jgi:hypothetical protein
MKAHRFKTKLTTKEEVENEFFGILNPRIQSRFEIECKGKGILAIAEFRDTKEGKMVIADEKLKLMDEWENKGRSLKFLSDNKGFNYMDLLQQKHFGRNIS